MFNPRALVVLTCIAIFFPPLGVPLLLGYIALMIVGRAGRDGGLLTRRKMDAWAAQEPWVTGDDEADQQILAQRIAAAAFSKEA
jgi:hypothetical protein